MTTKLKGKIVYHKTSGKELGLVTRTTRTRVYFDDDTWESKDNIVPVKRSRRARKGRAPSEKTQARMNRQADDQIHLTIPDFLKRTPSEEKLTTRNYQFKIFGPGRRGSKVLTNQLRSFDKFSDAQEYINHLTIQGSAVKQFSTNGRGCNLISGELLWSNYQITDILLGKSAKGLLPDIFTVEDTARGKDIKMPKTTYDTSTKETTMTAKKTATTTRRTASASDEDLVLLKHVCQELKLDPRKARMMLRKKLGTTDGRWAWGKGSKELNEVRSILKGENVVPEKVKAAARRNPGAAKAASIKRVTTKQAPARRRTTRK